MKKLLFVHGAERLKEDEEGTFYTGGSYNQEVWDRYFLVFSEISVIFRKDSKLYTKEHAREKFQFFDKNRINFIQIPDITKSLMAFLNIKKRSFSNHTIEKAVRSHDCLIARLPSVAGYKAIEYAKKYNKPYLVEAVGCPWDSLWNHSLKGKVIATPKYFQMRQALKQAPFVLYVTKYFLQNRYPTKGISINCSDVSLPLNDTIVLEKRLGRIKNFKGESNKIIIGTIADLNVRYKGQKYIIEAISRLNKQGYNFEYHLVGGGQFNYLKSQAVKYGVSNKVKFLGSIPHNEVFDYLDNIDIYIQPSKQEGLPRALVEAMSRACPALGSNIGGIPELLNSEFLFKSGDVKGICELLKKIDKNVLTNEALRNFEKSKDFNKDLLNRKRKTFYEKFSEMSNLGDYRVGNNK